MRVKFNSLLEGTHYDTEAAKILVKAGLFDESEARNIIQDLFKNKIHAFSYADLKKYLKGIARMCVEESNGDTDKARKFLEDSADIFNKYLTYLKEERDKQEDKTSFDKIFMNQTTYQEVKDFVEEHKAEMDKKSKEELNNMQFNGSSNYELIPINSYEEFHDKFGGRLTGNGESDAPAGGGGTAWCHANGENTYRNWVKGGKYKFFVLARKDFKDIPFNPKTNAEMQGKDDYGNSLIALRVKTRNNELENATLRCNHEKNIKNADNQYNTYAELSALAGFNVEEKINELNPITESEDVELVSNASVEEKKKILAEYCKVSLDDVRMDGRETFFEIFNEDGDGLLYYGNVYDELEAYAQFKDTLRNYVSNYGFNFDYSPWTDFDTTPMNILDDATDQYDFEYECRGLIEQDASSMSEEELIEECFDLKVITADDVDEDGSYIGDRDLESLYVETKVFNIGDEYNGNYAEWYRNYGLNSWADYNEIISQQWDSIDYDALAEYFIDDYGYEYLLQGRIYKGLLIDIKD